MQPVGVREQAAIACGKLPEAKKERPPAIGLRRAVRLPDLGRRRPLSHWDEGEVQQATSRITAMASAGAS
jgi:hypothetical protein